MCRILLVMGFAGVLLAAPAWAQAGDVPQIPDDVAFGTDVEVSVGVERDAFEPCMATDGKGGLYILWKDGPSGVSEDFFSYSHDWGATWSPGQPPVDWNYEHQSDPVVHVDKYSTVHLVALAYNSEANDYSACEYTRSFDRGLTFEEARDANTTGGGYNQFIDREWFCVDGDNVYLDYHVDYTQWFNASYDGGDTWEPAINLNPSTPGWISGPCAVAPDGTLYVTWEDTSRNIYVVKSTDKGQSFGEPNLVIKARGYDFNLRPTFWVLQSLCVDRRGNVYVCWTEGKGRSGYGADRGHTFVVKSADGGATWSDPIEINDDVGGGSGRTFPDFAYRPKMQPWMICDKHNRLHVVWYDARSGLWEIRYSFSDDGGQTWSPNVAVSDTVFNWDDRNYGDFLSCCVDDQYFYVVWYDPRDYKYKLFFDKAKLPIQGKPQMKSGL
jgi:hypothetical protein